MKDLFLTVLNMSITGSYVILFILLARLLLKKAPKKYSYALWAVAGFRLCCPVSFRSVFSLFSLAPFDMAAAQPAVGGLTYLPPDIGTRPAPQISTGIPAANAVINPVLPDVTAYTSPLAELQTVATALWLAGMIALAGYALWSWLRLRRSLDTATRLEEEIWQSETVRSPFILGLLRPRIYIPYGLEPAALDCILAHERYHLRCRDHLVRPFAFALVTLHWFNPLCWLAYILMSRDMELRCDEAVLAGRTDKTAYSTLLLSFAANRRMTLAPLAFGETGVKQRIKNALKWKKPARGLALLALVGCILTLAVCAADPRTGLLEGEPISYALCGDSRVAEADLQILLELINTSGYSRHSTGQVYRSDTDTLVALYGEDGTVWTLHYWYCSGFSWDPRHLGEDDYCTILSRLDSDGNPVSAWKLEYDFDDLFVYWKKTALNGVQEPVKLLQKYPTFFRISGAKGYEVYVRDNGFTLMSGTNRLKLREEVEQQPAASFEEILAILDALGAQEDEITFLRFAEDGSPEAVPRDSVDPRFDLDYCIEQALLANASSPRHDLTAVSYHLFDQKTEQVADTTRVTAYLWAVDLSWRYTLEEGGENTGGSSYPAVVTFVRRDSGIYEQIGFKIPRDGSYYDDDIRAMFPAYLLYQVWELNGNSQALHDLCWRKLSAAKPAALAEKIGTLFVQVASGPLHSSNPGSYIEAHPAEWAELLHYGEATFEWCCRRFLQGSQNGLDGHLYWAAVNQLIDGEAIKSVTGTGQESFDAWYNHVKTIRDKNNMEFLQKYYPWSYRLLIIADKYGY